MKKKKPSNKKQPKAVAFEDAKEDFFSFLEEINTFPGFGEQVKPKKHLSGIINNFTLQLAIDKYGIPAQIEKLEEECLELALALQRLKAAGGNYYDKTQAVIDEIADVKIMIEQAFYLFDKELINERIDYKMNRLGENLIKQTF